MPEPIRHIKVGQTPHCTQETNIAVIKEAILVLSDSSKKMEKGQDTIVELLKIVSNQTPRIEHLEEEKERNYKEMQILFDRIREAEMVLAASGPTVRQQFHEAIEEVTNMIQETSNSLAKLQTIFYYTTHKYAIAAYVVLLGMVIFGTVLDCYYHTAAVSWVVNVFNKIRGAN